MTPRLRSVRVESRRNAVRRWNLRLTLAASVGAICFIGLAGGCLGEGSTSSRVLSTALIGSQPHASGQSTPRGSGGRSARSVAMPYGLQATSRCLSRVPGVSVTKVSTNRRLRAMRDLAQQTSVVVRFRQHRVGLAVLPNAAQARLLAELLRAPRDPYRIVLRRNALLFFLPSAQVAFELTAGCLRPAVRTK